MRRSYPQVTTFSIVAYDETRREWGVAVESKFLACGALVPYATAEVGAIATQSLANLSYGPEGLALLSDGHTAQEVVDHLVRRDVDAAERQIGVVDANGGSASFTGERCLEWAGSRNGPGYAAQGNLLVSRETIDALAETFESSTADVSLSERLLDCLQRAQEAGGDRRGQQSAAILVVRVGGGYGGWNDRLLDLRVDDSLSPITDLRNLCVLHQQLFGRTERAHWIDGDASLHAEMGEMLRLLGFKEESLERAFLNWASFENYEERVDGIENLDPVVLNALRQAYALKRGQSAA